MPTPALPLLTKWSCADTCITAYDGFCERFTFTNIWPATAQCLLSSCSDSDRIALQKSVQQYCNAVGYPDVWGPYMWGASDGDAPSKSTSTPTSSLDRPTSTSPTSLSSTPSASTSPPSQPSEPSSIPVPNAVTTSPNPSIVASATPSPEAQASESSGLPTGAKAGIAVGIVIIVVLIPLIWLFVRWRRRKNEPNFPEGPDHSPAHSPKAKDFEEAPVISYSIEGGMLTRKEKPNLSIIIT